MNLDISYLGLKLRNPLVASAGPMTQTADRIERLAEAGVGAVVLPSLFEEQIGAEADRDERLAEVGIDSFGEAMTYLIDPDSSIWPRQYLSLIERAAGSGVPVIASLNGSTTGGWTDYARAMQDAGAAAIELNIYHLPGDPLISARDAEQRYIDILTTVKAAVSVPVAVKLNPYFSSLGEMAVRLDRAGADGLVLFNRFMQTDINPHTLTVSTGFRLSTSAEATLARSWIARLRGQVRASLAEHRPGLVSDDGRRRGRPGQRGRPRLRGGAARLRAGHRLRAAAARLRPADRPAPGDRLQAGRDGHQGRGGPPDDGDGGPPE